MQEEVVNRSIHFAFRVTKLSVKCVMGACRKASKLASKMYADRKGGKQTVKELIGQNQGVKTIPIAETELADFEKVAKKYGVHFAVRLDKSEEPARYTVFFKARDEAALESVLKEYSAQALQKEKKPSVREKLRSLIEKVASMPKKAREKNRELER